MNKLAISAWISLIVISVGVSVKAVSKPTPTQTEIELAATYGSIAAIAAKKLSDRL